MDSNIYNVIIVGAGAAGLFCGAHIDLKGKKGLILEEERKVGMKLSITGHGRCNLTRSENIKEFLDCYGGKGREIRKILFSYNNLKVMDFFRARGVEVYSQDDFRVFPKSDKAEDVRLALLDKVMANGFQVLCNHKVESIEYKDELYIVNRQYKTENIVIATGGITYRPRGNRGNMAGILLKMGCDMEQLKPALAPIYVENYNISNLSGITLENTIVSIEKKNGERYFKVGSILITHKGLSGPSILNLSRYAEPGDIVRVDLLPAKNFEDFDFPISSKKSLLNIFAEYVNVPKGFLGVLFDSNRIDYKKAFSETSKKDIRRAFLALKDVKYVVSGKGSFSSAIVTKGGVRLTEIDKKTMELKKHKGFYVIGEALDVDGDTGGYNLQFAFSTGGICGMEIARRLDN